uniref:Nudix hydrolase domain-containing protein n=1 Tax=Tetraselmis sp. GSL018 TaxID=582737 RepID=A0A061R9D1_9CHLO
MLDCSVALLSFTILFALAASLNPNPRPSSISDGRDCSNLLHREVILRISRAGARVRMIGQPQIIDESEASVTEVLWKSGALIFRRAQDKSGLQLALLLNNNSLWFIDFQFRLKHFGRQVQALDIDGPEYSAVVEQLIRSVEERDPKLGIPKIELWRLHEVQALHSLREVESNLEPAFLAEGLDHIRAIFDDHVNLKERLSEVAEGELQRRRNEGEDENIRHRVKWDIPKGDHNRNSQVGTARRKLSEEMGLRLPDDPILEITLSSTSPGVSYNAISVLFCWLVDLPSITDEAGNSSCLSEF